MRVSIIGTAGRNGTYKTINPTMYIKMVEQADKLIEEIASKNNISKEDLFIVSGGAALSDHVAVSLLLMGKIKHLHLHLPCPFDLSSSSFISDENSYSPSSRTSFADSANAHHENFSNMMSIAGNSFNSLEQLTLAFQNGATYDVSPGFFARNSKIAQCNYLIAFVFESGRNPKPDKEYNIEYYLPSTLSLYNKTLTGGTGDTWKKAEKNAVRILVPLEIFN